MQTLLIEIESPTKAKELTAILSSINFIKKVSRVNKRKALLAALQEHEIVKAAIVSKKNSAIAKYL